MGWCKVNVDAAFDQGSRVAGLGIIIRNELGQVILSAWRAVFDVESVEEVEARACLEGVQLASEWCRQKIIVESDCQNVVAPLNSGLPDKSLVFLLREIKSSSLVLPDVSFQTVKRERNVIAHELSQLAKRNVHTAVWRERVPRCVEALVAQDYT
ncbi:hypothetical protein EJB05_41234, partial [Eragrostis curvula]